MRWRCEARVDDDAVRADGDKSLKEARTSKEQTVMSPKEALALEKALISIRWCQPLRFPVGAKAKPSHDHNSDRFL